MSACVWSDADHIGWLAGGGDLDLSSLHFPWHMGYAICCSLVSISSPPAGTVGSNRCRLWVGGAVVGNLEMGMGNVSVPLIHPAVAAASEYSRRRRKVDSEPSEPAAAHGSSAKRKGEKRLRLCMAWHGMACLVCISCLVGSQRPRASCLLMPPLHAAAQPIIFKSVPANRTPSDGAARQGSARGSPSLFFAGTNHSPSLYLSRAIPKGSSPANKAPMVVEGGGGGGDGGGTI